MDSLREVLPMSLSSFDVVEPMPGGDGVITVVHVGEGHRYTFPIVSVKRYRILSDRPSCQLGGSAKHSAFYCCEDARQFAEIEARKRGLID
jgi:hypothetical protein